MNVELAEFNHSPHAKVRYNNTLTLDGRVCNILFELKNPHIVAVDNFVSYTECLELINLSKDKLDRSKVTGTNDNRNVVDSSRTSSGMFFKRKENALIEEIEKRISELTNWPTINQENAQVLRYVEGQEFKPHYDYFPKNLESSKIHLERGGQRLGSIIIYLNNCAEGGSTIFPEIGLEVKPVRGTAVFFSYPDEATQFKSLHGGSPVISGEKWVMVKWLRQSEFK